MVSARVPGADGETARPSLREVSAYAVVCGCGAVVAALVLTAGLSGPASGAAAPPDRERGGPGSWTKISTGGSGTTYQSSLYRTADGVLHVVYPKGSGSADQLGHVAISPNGSVRSPERHPAVAVVDRGLDARRWSGTATAACARCSAASRRRVVGTTGPTGGCTPLTAPESGPSWTLPAEAVGESHSAYGSYGTAATTLADGTPIAAFPLNSDITWHVGTGERRRPVLHRRPAAPTTWRWCATATTSGSGGTPTAARPPRTARSSGRSTRPSARSSRRPDRASAPTRCPTGRVALVAAHRRWRLRGVLRRLPQLRQRRAVEGRHQPRSPRCRAASTPPSSRSAPGRPAGSGLAWSDNIPRVRTVRTGKSGAGLGPVRTVGMPPGHGLGLRPVARGQHRSWRRRHPGRRRLLAHPGLQRPDPQGHARRLEARQEAQGHLRRPRRRRRGSPAPRSGSAPATARPRPAGSARSPSPRRPGPADSWRGRRTPGTAARCSGCGSGDPRSADGGTGRGRPLRNRSTSWSVRPGGGEQREDLLRRCGWAP